MKKLYKGLKRLTAFILVCFMLSFSSMTGYLAYTAVPVQASILTSPLVLAGLLEAIFASMGLTFSSRTDLDNMVSSLDGIMEANPSYTYDGVLIFDDIKEAVSDAVLGAKVKLTTAAAEWLSKWLYNSSSATMSSAIDVKNPSLGSLAGTEVIYGDFSKEFFEEQELFLGAIKVGTSTGSYSFTIEDNKYIYSNICNMLVSIFLPQDNGDGILYLLYPASPVITTPKKLSEGVSIRSGSVDLAVCDSVFELYDTSGNPASYFNSVRLKYVGEKNWIYPLSGYSSYKYLNWGTSSNDYFTITNLPASCTNAYVKVFINNGTRLYDSYEEYQMINFYTSVPTSAVYGLTSSAKDLAIDDTGEYVTVELLENSITSSVEKVVANALAENSAITDAELNALAAEQVAAIAGVQDSVEENTNVLSGIMSNILTETQSISSTLENMFVVDIGAIDVAISGFDTLWADKMPFINKLTPMLEELQFVDTYDYPVIKMQTPQVLNTFYKEEYIILCDFEDYANVLLWCRNIIKALLWFSFFLSIFNHLKSDFSVG